MAGSNERVSLRRGVCGGFGSGAALALCTIFLAQAMSVTAAAAPGRSTLLSPGEPTTSSRETISRLAFGSCNKQYLPQPMWSSVEELSPDVWLWIGDAVYVDKLKDGAIGTENHGELEKMKQAYAQQLANPDYQRFLSKVPRVEGVWDDHDYGVNDAGKRLSDHPGRVAVFLDFLGVGPEDPRRGGGTLYASHVFGESPRQVKVISLDLRTQRDDYYAFNIAQKFKLAAMLGAFLRWFSSSFCLGSDYGGSVIGEDQWRWLEEQLTDSQASVHVLVSTLQVMTSNPLMESWGHFPQSRRRFLELLRRTNPAGLVILSGDVHLAELASGWRAEPEDFPQPSSSKMPDGHPSGAEVEGGRCPFARGREGLKEAPTGSDAHQHSVDAGLGSADPRSADACAAHAVAGGNWKGRGVVEVTSSGMTHSCVSSHGRRMCQAFLDKWRQHRWRDDAYYLDENFGDIEIEWADDDSAPQPARMTVTVRDTNGTAILPVVDHFGDIRTAQQHQHQEQPERTFLDRSPLPECVHPVLPGGCTAKVFSTLVAFVVILVASCVGLASGTRRIFDMGSSGGGSKRSKKADKNNISSANGNGSRKDAHNRVVS